MWLTLLFFGTAAIFVALAASALWHLRWARRLPELEMLVASGRLGSPSPAIPVRCSVVIAARDEEARIEQTIRHLLAQRGVDFEVIVVDDRSRDRTGEILRTLAGEDSRLQVKTIDTLPAGWLGKCHACHLGAQLAWGDWILFTDADCWLSPDVIQRAVSAAERDGADHVTLCPETRVESPWVQAWHLLFLTSLANWFSGVNRDRTGAHMGIGAFNLVRADAYRACGGYEALRLSVVDDIKLGLLLGRAGKRTRAYLGVNGVECHWGHTVRGMIRIMEKNYFAITNFRVWLVVAGVLGFLLVLSLVIAGLFSGSLVGLSAGLSPALMCLPGLVLARRVGWPWSSALLVPLMFPVFMYSLVHSTAITLRQGGIRWRDTFYPLNELRAGNVN